MIKILDEQFQKRVRNGALALDCATVITIAISVREDLAATPMVRCDIAYGTETEPGEFDPWDYNNSVTTIPIFIEGPERFGMFLRAKQENVLRKGEREAGTDFIDRLLAWFEDLLVKEGQFGPGAEIVRQKPMALKKAEMEP